MATRPWSSKDVPHGRPTNQTNSPDRRASQPIPFRPKGGETLFPRRRGQSRRLEGRLSQMDKSRNRRLTTQQPANHVDIGLSRADGVIANDMISFSPKLHTFTIAGTDSKPIVATLYPEYCSCGAKDCFYILAVKNNVLEWMLAGSA